MVILDLEVLKKGTEVGVRLGNPQDAAAASSAPAPTPTSQPARPPPQRPSSNSK